MKMIDKIIADIPKLDIENEDKIDNGCDKYFKNDKWYKEFMKDIDKKYQKLR